MASAWRALAAYTAIALVATWPLVRGLGRDVAWDLGDPLLNMWILAWDAEQLLGILRGDFSRLATFFDGNIFYPAPLTLAYSEHLLPQAIQILPIYAFTRNPILCYNLLFLSTFILSGLGTYLFVRELTGKPAAAFLAGLLFAFAPYRLPQSSHVQVLSAQWMPFALYAFRRYFSALAAGRGTTRPLAGAAAALSLQNLSCGYYLFYFSPFAAGYAVWEMARHGVWRQWKVWAQLSSAAVAVVAVTVPFLVPYLVVNEQIRFERPRAEVVRYSADVYSYATAFAEQPVWGEVMRAFPKPEGDLFPGLVPLLLALIGVFGGGDVRRGRQTGLSSSPLPGTDTHDASLPPGPHAQHPPPLASGPWNLRSRWIPAVLAAGCIAHFAAAGAALLYRRIVVDLWLFELRLSNVNQMLLRAVIFGVLLLLVSPAARSRARQFARDRGFFVVAAVVAMWLSLGPSPQAQGRPVELLSPYNFLFETVLGFDGVRVPARYAMVAVLMLSVLAGFGAARIARWRGAPILLAILAVAALAESVVLPFTVNGAGPIPGYNMPEARVYRPQRAPNVYKEFARQAPTGVLAELPLGKTDFDVRAVYYSTVHWRPLLNGYSGHYPPHYGKLALALSDVPRFSGEALEGLRAHGATHVIVHEGAFVGDLGVRTSATLQQHGARELYRDGADVLLELR
jgi:hypothetical protein